MKNKALIILLLICMLLVSSTVISAGETDPEAFGIRLESGDTTCLSVTGYDDYTCRTMIEDTGFNAGVFSLNAFINDVGWLGLKGPLKSNIKVTTGASDISLLQLMPNLITLGLSERIAYAKLTGNTFECRRLSRWNEESGTWETGFSTPYTNIREAFDELKPYITCTPAPVRIDRKTNLVWVDNIIKIPAGTVIRYGTSEVRFTGNSMINDLKTEASFKKCLRVLRNTSRINENGGGEIAIWLPEGAELTLCETRFILNKGMKIALITGKDPGSGTDPLRGFIEAINASYIDSDTVVRTGANIINELLGDLAASDAEIIVKEEAAPKEPAPEKNPGSVSKPDKAKKKIQPKSLVIKSKRKVKLRKGRKHQIKAVCKPKNCSYKITYKSTNRKVARVSSKGKVRAMKKGKAKIIVKCGTIRKTVRIIVTK